MKLTALVAPMALIVAAGSAYVAWDARQSARGAMAEAERANRLWTEKPDWGMELLVGLSELQTASRKAEKPPVPVNSRYDRESAEAIRELKEQQARDAAKARLLELDRQISDLRASR